MNSEALLFYDGVIIKDADLLFYLTYCIYMDTILYV